jgi:hypothetical protein
LSWTTFAGAYPVRFGKAAAAAFHEATLDRLLTNEHHSVKFGF